MAVASVEIPSFQVEPAAPQVNTDLELPATRTVELVTLFDIAVVGSGSDNVVVPDRRRQILFRP